MTATHDVLPRQSSLGGESRTRGMFGSLSLARGLVLVVLVVLALIVLVVTQSIWLLALFAIVTITLYLVLQRRTADGEPWTETLSDELRWRVARRQGWDRYDPLEAGRTPLETGSLRFVGVSATETGRELSVTFHGLEYATTVLEVVGGGDGMREMLQTNAAGARFGRLLARLARPDLPVDQVDFSTRVLPVRPDDYTEWIQSRLAPGIRPELADSMNDLAEQAAWSGEAYRSWITIRMPRSALVEKSARTIGRTDEEAVAETAFDTTAAVARAAVQAGLTVRAGMGPRHVGALIRHLYLPSYGFDDQTDIAGARDGFTAYDATGPGHRLGFEAVDQDGTTWWHATMTVPRDGLPLAPVGVRWLECLVTDVNPPVLRTVTSQFRLVPKREARTRAATALTMDQAAIRKDARRGVVSTGEKEAQATVPQMVLDDLLHEDAAGAEPLVRVTVSAPSLEELVSAREVLESAAQDGGITRVRWHETRHQQAQIFSLPLGKGVAR